MEGQVYTLTAAETVAIVGTGRERGREGGSSGTGSRLSVMTTAVKTTICYVTDDVEKKVQHHFVYERWI